MESWCISILSTPTIGGFVLSAGWYNGTNQEAVDAPTTWDVALRYAGEFGAIRVAAGVGYRVVDNLTPTSDTEVISGSASIMHVPTGLFLNGAYGDTNDDNDERFGAAEGSDNSGWGISGGIQGKWNSLGNTTLEVRYTQFDSGLANVDPTSYGVGISQNIDAAAMDVYLLWENYDTDLGTAADDVNVVTLGTRVRF